MTEQNLKILYFHLFQDRNVGKYRKRLRNTNNIFLDAGYNKKLGISQLIAKHHNKTGNKTICYINKAYANKKT